MAGFHVKAVVATFRLPSAACRTRQRMLSKYKLQNVTISGGKHLFMANNGFEPYLIRYTKFYVIRNQVYILYIQMVAKVVSENENAQI
jgi:hypothetical protein